jgi:hypothetical protein
LGFPLPASCDSLAASEDTMRPKKHEATGEGDLFRTSLDQINNMKHKRVQLGGKIDWAWIDGEIAPYVRTSNTASRTSAQTSATGGSAGATSSTCCWPRACG